MVSVSGFEFVACYTDICLCLLVVSGCYTSFVEDADLQAVAFDKALLGVSAVTWSAVVRVVWLFLAVVSLQYFDVVPFNEGFHIFAAAVAYPDSVSVE